MNILTSSAFLIKTGILLLLSTQVLSAPNNDNLANAITIEQIPSSQQVDTSGASNEPDELKPDCLNEVANSVWYQYTATNQQTVVFDSFGSNYNTVISVWTGTHHPLTQLACNDDSSNTEQSQVQIDLQANTTYYINVSGFNKQTGSLVLNATFVQALTNDHINDAIVISPTEQLSYRNTQTVKGATLEFKEATASCAQNGAFATVWYQYTPTATQTVVFNTIGSDYNTVLAIWTGNKKHPMNETACNDDMSTQLSQLTIELRSEKTYYISIAVGKMGSGTISPPTGLLILNMTLPPRNDHLAHAIPVTEPLPFSANQYTGGATMETNELLPTCSLAVASVWYLFIPTKNYDNVTFSTATSGYNTTLSVWQGTSHSLSELACSDDTIATEQSNTSQLTIPLTENLTYYIGITGVNGETGNLNLRVAEGQLDFHLAPLPAKTIQECQSATLSINPITLDGKIVDMIDPVGSQWENYVALPFVYQWYQGESGDQSIPVGKDSFYFQTPPLTKSSRYWARIHNPTGTLLSETIVVNVEPLDNKGNGAGVDASGHLITTQAHFMGDTTTVPLNEKLTEINPDDTISVNFMVKIDPNHLGQPADILTVAAYTEDHRSYSLFMRQGKVWQLWDGNVVNLEAVTTNLPLTECIQIDIFKGILGEMPGEFLVYVGYRHRENGNIYFNGEPLTFRVKPE